MKQDTLRNISTHLSAGRVDREGFAARYLEARAADHDRINRFTLYDVDAEIAEFMKLIDGRSRGLPSEDLPPLLESEIE